MLLYPDTVESEFAEWLPGLGLETQSEVRKLRRKLELAANAHGSETDGERVARVLEVVAAHDSKTAMRSTRHQAAPVAV